MKMFVYTKNKNVVDLLKADNCTLLKKRDDGVYVYALSPISKFQFDKQKDTWVSGKIVL